MIGDRIIIEQHHVKKADKIFNSLNNHKGKKSVIAIAGVSGGGKTEIGQILQEKLWKTGLKCFLLSIDDYYKSSWVEREQIRKETNIIGHKEIYWRKINKIIKKFKNNERDIYVQRLNKFTDQLEHTRINGNIIDVIIVEGLYALYSNFDFGVYLDATQEQTYKFRKKRKKENPDNVFRKHVLLCEEKDVIKSKSKANIIIRFGE